jgi:hypothetical protein
MTEARCMRCKKQVEIKDGKMSKTKNGVPILKGICPTCGTIVCRMGGIKNSTPSYRLNEETDEVEEIPEEIIEDENDETQNLKQASIENNPLKSEQVDVPVLEKTVTPLFRQEEVQLNNPPAFIPEIKPTPESKIKSHLEKYGRTITTIEEKEKFEKVKSQLPFWQILAVISLIIIIIFACVFGYFISKGKFQTQIGDTHNDFNASIQNDYQNSYSPTTNNQYQNNFTIIVENKIYTNST